MVDVLITLLVHYNASSRAADRWLVCVQPVCSGMVVGLLTDFCPIWRSIQLMDTFSLTKNCFFMTLKVYVFMQDPARLFIAAHLTVTSLIIMFSHSSLLYSFISSRVKRPPH